MEKKLLTLFLSTLLISSYSTADDLNQAYSDGTAAAKSIKSQGQASLSTNTAESTVPGYTSNPSETGYYGGVRGNSNSLDSDAIAKGTQNEIYKDVVKSQQENPTTKINADSDYIQAGVNSVNNADQLVSDDNGICKDVNVTKTTFTNYSCQKDIAVSKTCNNTASVITQGGVQKEDFTEVINSNAMNIHMTQTGKSSWETTGEYTVSNNEKVIGVNVNYSWNSSMQSGNSYYYKNIIVTTPFGSFTMAGDSGTVTLNPGGKEYNDGDKITVSMVKDGGRVVTTNDWNDSAAKYHFNITLSVERTVDTLVAKTVWNNTCGSDMGDAVKTSEVCTQPGGTRYVNVNGKTLSQYESCWNYQSTWQLNDVDDDTCKDLDSKTNCTVADRQCTNYVDQQCSHQDITYQCQTSYASMGKVCGGQYFCESGDCQDTAANNDSGFNSAVSELAGLASAANDVKGTSMSVSAFTGDAVSCRKAMAGFADCCKNSGWGTSAGLAHCNSEEKAIGKAKEKKIVVKIGTTCAKKVLGACIQKKEVYCQFNGKLARIIQEQGRRDQLGISFGSAKSPNCRGLTVDELQKINFDKINFSDFYSDLESQENLPNNQQTIDEIKDKINSQVNAMKGK